MSTTQTRNVREATWRWPTLRGGFRREPVEIMSGGPDGIWCWFTRAERLVRVPVDSLTLVDDGGRA